MRDPAFFLFRVMKGATLFCHWELSNIRIACKGNLSLRAFLRSEPRACAQDRVIPTRFRFLEVNNV